MRRGLLATLVLFALATASRAAESGDPCCVQTLVQSPIHLYPQPPSPPPVFGKPVLIPPIKWFTMEESVPKCKEGPPQPPIKIFTQPPPPVKVFTMTPPVPRLMQFEQKVPKLFEIKPPTPIKIFTMEQTPPIPVPTLRKPPITVYTLPPPCPPKLEPCKH